MVENNDDRPKNTHEERDPRLIGDILPEVLGELASNNELHEKAALSQAEVDVRSARERYMSMQRAQSAGKSVSDAELAAARADIEMHEEYLQQIRPTE